MVTALVTGTRRPGLRLTKPFSLYRVLEEWNGYWQITETVERNYGFKRALVLHPIWGISIYSVTGVKCQHR